MECNQALLAAHSGWLRINSGWLIASVRRLKSLHANDRFPRHERTAMRLTAVILLCAICAFPNSRPAVADEPVTLMGIISQWMYPKSAMNGAEMSDGATLDSEGNRTVQSIVCKTTMTTDDPVEKVVAFYKTKLAPDKNADAQKQEAFKDGRSVLVSDDSNGRPFALHTILVNTATTSTTLIISHADNEKQTHIVWKHYARL